MGVGMDAVVAGAVKLLSRWPSRNGMRRPSPRPDLVLDNGVIECQADATQGGHGFAGDVLQVEWPCVTACEAQWVLLTWLMTPPYLRGWTMVTPATRFPADWAGRLIELTMRALGAWTSRLAMAPA